MLFRFLTLSILLLPVMAVAQTSQPATIQDKLAMRLPELTLDGQTLTQVLTAIADKTRLNIVGEWDKLKNLGVDRDQKLRGRLFDVTATQAIEVALMEAGVRSRAALDIRDDVLVITGPPVVVTRVYTIGKLLEAIPKPPAVTPSGQAPDPNEPLVRAIAQIEPETWRDAGGTVGSVSFLGRKMIITHTPEVHAKIEQLLKELEKSDVK